MASDCAVVVFAKAPRPGQVKTRLTRGRSEHLEALSPRQSAELYAAFLRDYVRRLAALPPGMTAFFCLREALDEREAAVFGEAPVIVEPRREGRRAADLGQAMAWTIEERMAAGFRRVILLGSDLPHLPLALLTEARALLASSPLVLGSDGGGCYLIGASGAAAPEVLSSGIPWSQGRDFELLRQGQEARGLGVGLLEELVEDIDTPEQLGRLIERLAESQELRRTIPETVRALRRLGANIPAERRLD